MTTEHASGTIDATHPPHFENEEEAARWWMANVYQGDNAVQLTPRAVITGMLIGGVMSISNLYVGLKTGWGLGVTITACIIAYAVFKFLETVVPAYRDRPFSILENYTMSSAASAAGYMSSAGLVSALPALYLTTKTTLTWWEIMCWLGAISMLGVFMAIPLKRQLINIDQLPFPSGIATAETLKSMHTAGTESILKARSLMLTAAIGALVAIWKDGLPAIAGWYGRKLKSDTLAGELSRSAMPSEFPLMPGGGELLHKLTLGFEGSTIMVAAGAIMGIRVGVSLLLGAIIYYGLIAPELIERGIVEPGYRGIVKWTVWPATGMMVAGGLLSFALRWRTVLRAFSGLTRIFLGGEARHDPLSRVEVPGSWFVIGTLIAGTACVVFGHLFFGISYPMGVLAVAVTFLLSIVAARATGETDITPIGAMGKITQLIYGAIYKDVAVTNAVAATTTNLMTASITSGAASHAADLLTDLKSGYLLGGNPRKQTISQLFGVAAGTIMCVPVYMILVTPAKLESGYFPAPAAKVWASVAELLSKGIAALPTGAQAALVVGAILGCILTLLEEFVPRKHRKWIPSSTGLGIAGVIPAYNAFSMFLGAAIAWLLEKFAPLFHERYTIAGSSGLIAGESLMGVTIILIQEGPGMLAELIGVVWPYLDPAWQWVAPSVLPIWNWIATYLLGL